MSNRRRQELAVWIVAEPLVDTRAVRAEQDPAMPSLDATLIAEEDELWNELHETMDSFTPEQTLVPGYHAEGWSAKDALAHVVQSPRGRGCYPYAIGSRVATSVTAWVDD